MQLTEIRVHLCAGHSSHCHGSRLRAFCSLTFDHTFVVRDVKLIEGSGGLFLAMPSRKICDHCPACGDKNHLRARYCNQCGTRLDEDRYLRRSPNHPGTPHAHGSHTHATHAHAAHAESTGDGPDAPPAGRVKLFADVAHPINARCRHAIERQVLDAYAAELERSKLPGYIPQSLDHDDFDVYDPPPASAVPAGNAPSGYAGPAFGR